MKSPTLLENNIVPYKSPSPKNQIKNISKEILKNNYKLKNISIREDRVWNSNISSSNKSPMLFKDNVNVSPGYGLWCQNLNDYDKVQNFPNKLILSTGVIGSDIESVSSIDKKLIEQLRDQVNDLISKLQSALTKYYDSDFRAKRAEETKHEISDLADKKIKENLELSNTIKNLQEELTDYSCALSNSKNEIARLKKDLDDEKLNYRNLQIELERIISEKNSKIDQLSRDNRILIEKIQNLTTTAENQSDTIKKTSVAVGRRSGVSLENDLKKFLSKVEKEEEDRRENPDIPTPVSAKNSVYNDKVLKFQLEIVDLKKKLSEDESQISKLLQIIKSKNEKINIFKNNFENLASLFEENNKDLRWNQKVVNKKNSMIQFLKEKIQQKDDEGKKLLNDIKSLQKNKKIITFEAGVEVSSEEIFPVKSSILFD
jgi:chromosome segregation ATPase